ncbi:(R)-1-hydroxy-2-aminoethylphosphonate ammonia-lyase [Sneathiella glossodoripedis]|uniref:(R)-1-hydroxy-2-aminoethylphosphonate ammonia-lyase n=1 Tax=Sneathiella glossodoripedis TaxID=418853 RepID=UPI00047190C6|nr:aspartate aminotransferase family protein [Sneathiella glossodoripedis]
MSGGAASNQTPHQSEGDVNFSKRRQDWAATNIDAESNALLARDAKAFLHQSVSTPCLNTISKAEGAYIYDGQGRRYLDFHGNNVHHIGYGHPKLKEAINRQMNELPFAPRRFTCEPAVALAEKLGEISPGDLSKVLFATGGSDAIEMALKVARAKTGRFKTVSFWDAFHGAGFGASSVGGEQLFRGQAIGPLLPGSEHVAPFACYRCPYGYDVDKNGAPDQSVCKTTCANMIRYVLEKEGNVAAVIAEPARAVPYTPPSGFWKMVREACNDAGALLIFDEIPTGLGKTGKMFACDHDEVVPDILVMGKALGGGILPIAAMLCRPELDVLGDYAIGHYTHEKNPVTTQAALTTIEIIDEEKLVENAEKVGTYAINRMKDIKNRFSMVGDVRGRGFLLGMELVTDQETKEPASDAAEEILYHAFDKGLSFKTTMGNVLTFTPPLITTIEQLDFALDVIEEGLKHVQSRSKNI